MRIYSLLAFAKINLYLEIIGDRPDGYHELAMVMQSVSLADRVSLRELSVDEVRIQCNHPEVPTDRRNLAYRVVELMWERFPDLQQRHGGVEITIEKQIPVGAGLAGGSADAAAVLVGLNLLWKLGLTHIELQELGQQLGSDIPFCITGGTAIATGRGEKIAPLGNNSDLHVVLAKHRSISISTPWAYGTFREKFRESYVSAERDLAERWHQVHSGALVAAIGHHNPAEIGQHLYNDFEKIVLPAYPQVGQLRDTLAEFSSLGAMMSGSGPTVFALAHSRQEAERIRQQAQVELADPDIDFWVAQFCSSGVQLSN